MALVIGNSDYDYVNKLQGPRKDAFDMASLFQSLNFNSGRVQAHADLDHGSLRDAIEDFTEDLIPGDLVAFYYSGHGVQGGNGQNYLLPTDAKFYEPEDVELRCYPVKKIIDKIAAARCTGLLFLDACRDDPFSNQPDAERTKSVMTYRKGLALAEKKAALPNILISYAAAPGRVAKDGNQKRNSHYTAALLAHLPTPGLPIEDALKRVTNQVVSATGEEQQPWLEGSLNIEKFMLVPDAASGAAQPLPTLGSQPISEQPEDPPVPLPVGDRAAVIADDGNAGSSKTVAAAANAGSVKRTAFLIAGLAMVALGIGAFLIVLSQRNSSRDCDFSTVAGAMVCNVADLDHQNPATRKAAATAVDEALAGTRLTAAEMALVVAALLDLAEPGTLRSLTADGRFNVLTQLSDVPLTLWLDPAMIQQLETAYQTIEAIEAAHAADPMSGSRITAFLARWKTNAGYLPRTSITVLPHFAGWTRAEFQTVMDSLATGWGWQISAIDQEGMEPRLAEIRYSSDDMQASALLMAAQLNLQIAPRAANARTDPATAERQIAAAGLPPIRAIKASIISRRTLELWISKQP